MNVKIIRTLVKKEMLDVLRDKKTVIMMLVVPLVLYPLIFIGAMQIIMMIASGMETQSYRIAVVAEDDGALLRKLESGQAQDDSGKPQRTADVPEKNTDEAEEETEDIQALDGAREETEDIQALDGAGEETEDIQALDGRSIGDYEAALQDKSIDAYVTGTQEGGRTIYQIYYLSSEENSSYALGLIQEKIEELKTEVAKQRVEAAGLDAAETLEPVAYEEKDIASKEQSLGSILGMVLPFMLIISLLMGTMYPAIDTTAGERERGTLETILTLPVTNHQLIVGKFLTVAAIGIVSAMLNMVSMGGIAFYIYQVAGMQTDVGSFDAARFVPSFIICIFAVLAFSLFISAVTMCVTSFAKSYKEANNYITPLTLVVMLTGYIGFIPNLELTQTMALVPVANICLLVKNLLLFQIDQGMVAVVLISNLAYAALAILFLSKIYDSEAVLFGDGRNSFQIFEKRSNMKQGGVPSVSDTWFVVAVTVVLMLYAGSILQIKYGIWGVFATQMILLFIPLLVVLYMKKDVRLTYGFARTTLGGCLGAAILSVGLFLVNVALSYVMMELFPQSASRVSDSFSQIMDGGIAINLLVIALAPAVCEELLFRGFILHAMKEAYRPWVAIGITAALFGAYHMSVAKFVPTGLLGLALCYAVYRTGSIFPAMLIHFINNAISVVASSYPEQIGNVLPVFFKETLQVSELLLLAGIGLILCSIGLGVLNMCGGGAFREKA